MYHGLLVIDKPAGMTSRDVVNRAQGWFPRRTRIGHMGTLDPLATGVLVLGIGDGTKVTQAVQDMEKVYQAGILLGARSDTDDAEGIISNVAEAVAPSVEAVECELTRWIGDVEQVPPNYSAVKLGGRRAYDLSRRGQKIDLAGRMVRIYAIQLLRYAYPDLDLEVRCGKGTYLRSLARDLGQALGCGGLIRSLRRLRIGPFTTDQALTLEATVEEARRLLPLSVMEEPRTK